MNYSNSFSAGFVSEAVKELLANDLAKIMKPACRFIVTSNADLNVRDSKFENRQVLSLSLIHI